MESGNKNCFLGIIKSALDLIKGAESDTHTLLILLFSVVYPERAVSAAGLSTACLKLVHDYMMINVIPPDLYPVGDWQHKLHNQVIPVVFVSALVSSFEELICSNSEILCLWFTARNQNSEIFAVDRWIWFVFLFPGGDFNIHIDY